MRYIVHQLNDEGARRKANWPNAGTLTTEHTEPVGQAETFTAACQMIHGIPRERQFGNNILDTEPEKPMRY